MQMNGTTGSNLSCLFLKRSISRQRIKKIILIRLIYFSSANDGKWQVGVTIDTFGFFLAEEIGNVGPRARGRGSEVGGRRAWSLTGKGSFEFCPRISRMTRMGKRQRWVYSCDSWAILGVFGEFVRRLARARAAAGDSGAPVWRLERDCVHRTSRSV